MTTNEMVTKTAREAFETTKRDTGDDGLAFEAANEAIREMVEGRTGTFDQETLTWTFDVVVDLWEDNAGGLAIVDRARGVGFRGFERGQNEKRLRVRGRDEFTFASDATPEHFDDLGEGGAYQPMAAEDVEALYDREGETNQAVRVAAYEAGRVTVRARSFGASARWYLDTALPEND